MTARRTLTALCALLLALWVVPAAADTASEPDAPEGVTATPGVERITVSWDAPADNGAEISAYRVYHNGGLATEVAAGTTEWVHGPLPNGTTHTYEVSAVNDVGEGPTSEPVTATVWARPGPPQNFEARPGADFGTVYLRWDPPAESGGGDVVAYRIFRDGQAYWDVPADRLEFVDEPRSALVSRTYAVAAVTAVGAGARTEEQCPGANPWPGSLPYPCLPIL